MTDYVRLDVIYDHGGNYLDTDVELLKNLDAFLTDKAYFGFENEYINTGLGFGAEKGATILKELMQDYQSIPFAQQDGTQDMLPCPVRNTEVFLRHGLRQDGSEQLLDDGIHIYPMEFFCPFDYRLDRVKKTRRTVTIHWFAGSWSSEEQKRKHKEAVKANRKDYWVHLPNRIMIRMLGIERYEKFKKAIKG